jgi:hypothetical protein
MQRMLAPGVLALSSCVVQVLVHVGCWFSQPLTMGHCARGREHVRAQMPWRQRQQLLALRVLHLGLGWGVGTLLRCMDDAAWLMAEMMHCADDQLLHFVYHDNMYTIRCTSQLIKRLG